jgi:hypothetical protein
MALDSGRHFKRASSRSARRSRLPFSCEDVGMSPVNIALIECLAYDPEPRRRHRSLDGFHDAPCSHARLWLRFLPLALANLKARVPTITSVETNARQYLPQANKAWESRFPGMFRVSDGMLQSAPEIQNSPSELASLSSERMTYEQIALS